MNFCDIKPYIRFVEKSCGIHTYGDEPVAPYDHIMMYIMSGNARIAMNGQSYTIERGDIVIIKPATFFNITGNDLFEMIVVHFDFNNEDPSKKSFYQQPVTTDEFTSKKIIENTPINDEDIFNHDIVTQGFTHTEEAFRLIFSEYSRSERYFEFKISSYLISVLVDICRKEKQNEKKSKTTPTDNAEQVIEFIHKNYNHHLSVDELAEHFHFHATYINALVKTKTGFPVHKYIMMRRISKAMEMLQYTDMKIYEIVEEIGLSDISHFSKIFKQYTGKNPSEYRKNK